MAFLFVVAAGLRDTGASTSVASRIFKGADDERSALQRILFPVAGLSAFLNNTPIVAMLMPGVVSWGRRAGVSPSKLLLPLSYAAILGGTCTLIGTSTNLVVSGLLESTGERSLGMFELTPYGVPCALVGSRTCSSWGPGSSRTARTWPSGWGRSPASTWSSSSSRRNGPWWVRRSRRPACGASRSLPRRDRSRRGADRARRSRHPHRGRGPAHLAGQVDSIVDLLKIRGLVQATELLYEPGDRRNWTSQLCEAVVSYSSPLIGRTIRAAEFRSRHDAAVVAVHRSGEPIQGTKLGDVVLRAGDTLLLRTGPHFSRAHRDSTDFFLVSEIPETQPPRFERTRVAFAVLGAMVVAMGSTTPPTPSTSWP